MHISNRSKKNSQSAKKSSVSSPASVRKKPPAVKSNHSILTFFQKAKVETNESLFVANDIDSERLNNETKENGNDTPCYDDLEPQNSLDRPTDVIKSALEETVSRSSPLRPSIAMNIKEPSQSDTRKSKLVTGFIIDESDDEEMVTREVLLPEGSDEPASFDDNKSHISNAYMIGESLGEEELGRISMLKDNEVWSNDPQLIYNPASLHCPVCDAELTCSYEAATEHVNTCIDRSFESIPSPDPVLDTSNFDSKMYTPGEETSTTLETAPVETAFSAIMKATKEDQVWNSTDTQGPLFKKGGGKRQCPFYKIMPNLSICVDAFRYGAVEGCKAYFLSHFHSDHYIGLSSSWKHGPIYCSRVTATLVKQQLRVNAEWVRELDWETTTVIPEVPDVKVTMIFANHCPGSSMFLFEKCLPPTYQKVSKRILHCGDFRACTHHVHHPLLGPSHPSAILDNTRHKRIDLCYLDTTYLNPRYSFPAQVKVTKACADMCMSLAKTSMRHDVRKPLVPTSATTESIESFFTNLGGSSSENSRPLTEKCRILVVCGTYSIGKENICKEIARRLNSKIFAVSRKRRLCLAQEDEELANLITDKPLEAQVHMQSLRDLTPATLQTYMDSFNGHFDRVIGFRPSGWMFQSKSKSAQANLSPLSLNIHDLLHSITWRPDFTLEDFRPQRGSTKTSICFGVPYSEHSSFRDLALFILSLHIEKVIPTVNVGSDGSRRRMKGWIDRWQSIRQKEGPISVVTETEALTKSDDIVKERQVVW